MSHSNALDQVIELIGVHATIRLVRSKGGQELKFPQAENLHYLHWLVVEVGMDNAVKLCEAYKGATLKLPIEVNALLQLRNEAIARDFQTGMSVSLISKEYGCDRRLIQTVLSKYGLRDVDKVENAE